MKKTDRSNIDDIIALSPMQEGMLFHYLQDPRSDYYFEQLSLHISGEIDRDRFEDAWNFVIANNEALRTCFRWDKIESPVQVVLKEQKINLEYYDFSNSEPGVNIKDEVEKLKREDKKKKFDLQEIPFRVTLCKTGRSATAAHDVTKRYSSQKKSSHENKISTHNSTGLREYVSIISYHHILFDGWSTGILLRELLKIYTDLIRKKSPALQRKPKYKEFVRFIRDRSRAIEEEEFWQAELGDIDSSTSREFLLKSRNRGKSGRTHEATGNVQFRLDKNAKEELQLFIKDVRITMAALFYTAWGILLRKYNYADDVVFGTTVSVRDSRIPGIEDMVGLFIDTLPLRMRFRTGETSTGLLNRVNRFLRTREKFKQSALVDIKEYGGLTANEELFDSVVVIENYPLDTFFQQAEGAFSYDSHAIIETTHYDLTLIISLRDDVVLEFCCREDLFDKECMVRLAEHYISLLKNIPANHNKSLAEMDLITSTEKRKILNDFNCTEAAYPTGKLIQQIFEDQVEKIPAHTAITGASLADCKTGDIPSAHLSLTYRELNEAAGRLTAVLIAKGVRPGTIVGLMVDRSIEMVIAVLTILKTGAAYLPIDPAYPVERAEYMLKDSAASLLLTAHYTFTGSAREKCRGIDTFLIDDRSERPDVRTGLASGGQLFEKSWTKTFDEGRATGPVWALCDVPAKSLTAPLSAELAYIIYTSGSTGNPKGVPVEHAAVVNLLVSLDTLYPPGIRDVYLLKTSYLFDVSVAELFGWFLGGGCLSILEKGGEKEPAKIAAAVERRCVTHINFVPSQFNVFVDELSEGDAGRISTLKYIFLAGEALMPESVDRFARLQTGITLHNIYGPTEGTVYSSSYDLSHWKGGGNVPIGKPLHNIQLYIFDKDNRLQPVGVPGELCIAGTGLARGYLNRPELTGEKFPATRGDVGQDGLISTSNFQLSNFQRIYRTGDLALWQPDGNIEFLGRIDQQVKIRGFRIEPGEIESRLSKHEDVKEAVVISRGDERGDNVLCAYLTVQNYAPQPEAGEGARRAMLRNYLSQTLPDYMIPSYFIQIDKLPLTPSGKIDRKALPEPEIKTGREYTAPADKTQERLAEIWADVLHIDTSVIGIDDNFFDLGGHSLKVTKLLGRVNKEFNMEINFSQIFKKPTIREFSACINQTERSSYSGLTKAKKSDYYPLSPAQKRLYFLQQLETGSTTYNMPGIMNVEGEIEYEKVEHILLKLIKRHESLRTSFAVVAEEPTQKIHHPKDIEFHIDYLEAGSREQGSGIGQKQEPTAEIPSLGGEVEDRGGLGDHEIAIISRFIKPFDLSQAPLLRAGLIKTAKEKHILIVDMHHIISDGTSLTLLIRDFASLLKGEELPSITYRYRDYSVWINSVEGAKVLKKQETFWLEQFPGSIPVLNLPLDYPRPAVQDFTGRRLYFDIGEEETTALKNLALKGNVTLYMVVLAIFNVFCARLSGQEDIVVGSPIAGRNHIDLSGIIGMFVNMLALRNYPEASKGFADFLAELAERTTAAFENQDYPFEQLVENLSVNRDTGRNPLFDVALAMQDIEIPPVETPGLTFTPVDVHTGVAKFDLTFECELIAVQDRTTPVLRIKVEYSTGLFMQETIERYMTYFREIVNAVLADNRVKIGEIDILPGEEKRRILYDFNDSGEEYPLDKTIHELFSRQVERTPEHIAVVYEQEQLTYKKLHERSNRLAHWLRKQGARPNDLVAVMVERTLEMSVGILGILKSGCGYVPLNPKAPVSRNRFIMRECGVKIMLTADHIGKRSSREDDVEYIDPKSIVFDDIHMIAGLGSKGSERIGKQDTAVVRHFVSFSAGEDDIKYIEPESIVFDDIHMIAGLESTGGERISKEEGTQKKLPYKTKLWSKSSPEGSATAGRGASQENEVSTYSSSEGLPEPDPNNRAYVIFTSGSTGKPKGVAVTHANFCPLAHWGYRALGIGPGERTIRNLSYYFDWSVWEMFITLTTGASLYMVSSDVLLDPEVCIDFMTANNITILHVTPTQYQYIAAQGKTLPRLNYLFIGAEKLTYDLAERSFASVNEECRVFNMYGPTEATIIAAVLEIDRKKHKDFKRLSGIPIGKPAAGLHLFVLDKNDRLCPLNVPGELYIAGSGVAAGYLNRPELTDEKFIASGGPPFCKKVGPKTFDNIKSFLGVQGPHMRGVAFSRFAAYSRKSIADTLNGSPRRGVQKSPLVAEGKKIYKTGDLARWLPDGNIEFLGRQDFQVKIRGFRIEPGEIENRLLEHEGVKETVVIDFSMAGREKYLCAYVVGKNTALDAAELRRYLAQSLPNYMIPAYFMFIDNIPLNPNGKVDRKALPEPEITDAAAGYTPPGTETEEKLATIWSEVLGIDKNKIGIDSNFFEIGGHSLTAALLTAKVHKRLDVKLPLIEVFKNPTLKKLAEVIKGLTGDTFSAIKAVEKQEYYSLSSVQKRIYVVRQLQRESTGYNISNVVVLHGAIDNLRLENTFRQLISRHESFRTSFFPVGDSPVQKIHEPGDIEFQIEYLEAGIREGIPQERRRGWREPRVLPDETRPVGDAYMRPEIDRFIRPFDLSRPPLFRAGLLKLDREKYLFMMDMHHIISDGISHEILVKDFAAFYSGGEPAPMRIQYRDFSQWQNRLFRSGKLEEQTRYWLSRFADRPGSFPEMPLDFPRPAVRDITAGDHIAFELDKALYEKCTNLAGEAGTTLFMVLLTAYNILLSIYTNSEDIVVGTLLTGRSHADTSDVIGMFVNTLPIRNFPGRNRTFREFLKEVKENTLNVYENQDYGFDDLVRHLGLQGDSGRNPLFDTVFTMNAVDSELLVNRSTFAIEPYEYEAKFAKFDLYFLLTESGGALSILLRYSTQLFKPATIDKLAKHYTEVVEQVTENINIKLKEVTLSHDFITAESTAHREDGSDFNL